METYVCLRLFLVVGSCSGFFIFEFAAACAASVCAGADVGGGAPNLNINSTSFVSRSRF